MTANITIVGNATADPEMRFTAKGKPVTSFTVAVNERVQNEDGTWGDGDATFYRVSAWDYIAQPTYDAINKGTKVVVVGELKSRTYEDREGNTRTSLDVNAKTVGVAVKAQRLDTQPVSQQMEDAPF
jgi:single-strand DNA-binding protein